jgi:hypothetical protein
MEFIFKKNILGILAVLPHNGGFCNGVITKRILLFQTLLSWENQYNLEYDKKHCFNLLTWAIVRKDLLGYANTILHLLQNPPWCGGAQMTLKNPVLFTVCP